MVKPELIPDLRMRNPTIVDNATARRLFLRRHMLSGPMPAGTPKARLAALIDRLGFVQVDSVNTVARAHDLILFSRLRGYKPAHLRALLERDRALFENWTHDAAIIPTRFFPYWQRHFERHAADLHRRWQSWRRQGFEEEFTRVLAEIGRRGPIRSGDLRGEEASGGTGWWDWHPSKTAIEYLWRTGALAITRRESFQKVFDLVENVIPAEHRAGAVGDDDLIDWACRGALERLGFATSGELAAFWGLISPAEAKLWCERQSDLDRVAIRSHDGATRLVFAEPGLLDEAPPEPPGAIRILSPFDPMIRDRRRTEALFGLHYRIEIFVPGERRKYGYYVFPVLEGDRFAGRIDMKANRQDATLEITAFWPEPGVRMGTGRMNRLTAELRRIARFAGLDDLRFAPGWLRPQA